MEQPPSGSGSIEVHVRAVGWLQTCSCGRWIKSWTVGTVSQESLDINIRTKHFTDLNYADDMAILAGSCGDVVDSLETMSQEAPRFGLEINWTKTKIQPIGVHGTIPDHVLVAGNRMELVCGFCYPGSRVEADGGSGPEVCRRVASARNCMSSLQRGICKTAIRIDTKLTLYKAYILPILLYGAKTWTLTRAQETKLDVFQCWCLRRILRVPFSAHVTNSDIYQHAKQIPVSEMVQSRRPQLPNGQVARGDVEQDHARALKAMIGGPPRNWKRPVGCPCQTWLRVVTSDLLPQNLGPNAAWRRAQDRPLAAGRRNGNAPPWGSPLMMKWLVGVYRYTGKVSISADI